MKTLWTIGQPNGSMTDLALDADDFVKYPTLFPVGPMYVIGRSDPKHDWPHLHPGPLDTWAGGRSHTFTITFGLKSEPASGDCRVVVHVLDTNLPEPPRLRIALNDVAQECQLPPGSHYMLEERAAAGSPHTITMPVPANSLREGENVLTLTTTAGCWLVYDAIAFEGPADLDLAPTKSETEILHVRPLAATLRDGCASGGEAQLIELVTHHSGETTEATIETGDELCSQFTLHTGSHTACVRVPAVEVPTHIPIRILIDGKVAAEREFTLDPVRRWEVNIIHHTHLDIGYTHVQSEVLERQLSHIRRALELIRETADLPPEARFRWNPEGLWAVDAFLNTASDDERKAFLESVRAGSIGLDAFYANVLTGLCRPEELFELLRWARQMRTDYGLTIDSAMISDIPGYTWGIIPALAQSGVRYLSLGPNRAHRIGHTMSTWGDRPFYWLSPDGQHKVLCWMAGQGYSWFHGRTRTTETFGDTEITSSFDGQRLLAYLSQLQEDEYPYDIVQLRYTIDTDNGPPDADLPELVRRWNEKYVSPRLVLTTTHELMHALEERYGESIPLVSGDFTPYWEDGAGSTARETAMNRAAAERVVRAETLWTMLNPAAFPSAEFDAAWREVVLFDEHTWGSWNSISEPESELTKRQWAIKQQLAVDSDRQTRDLLDRATRQLGPADDPIDRFAVFNTSSWPRGGVVLLPADRSRTGDCVSTAAGEPVPSQRLKTGELAVLVKDIPPFAGAVFQLTSGSPHEAPGAEVSGNRLMNEFLEVQLDPKTGLIRSIKRRGLDANLVDFSERHGLGEYLYVAGRNPAEPQRAEISKLEVIETGPLIASIRAEFQAPGCEHFSHELRLVAGADHVQLIANFDRKAVLDPEAVYLAFPFAVAEPRVRVDLAWATMRPEIDQLPGACRNYFPAQRWVDVSDDQIGVTLATIDAPLIEIGEITTDATVVGWQHRVPHSGRILSYVMNNYWETNYRAAQPGPATIRYAIRPHGVFDMASAKRFGIERSQPLIVAPLAAGVTPPTDPLVQISPPDVLITRMRPTRAGDALMLRLFNPTDATQSATLSWSTRSNRRTWLSDPFEERGAPVEKPIEIPPRGIITLLCEH